MTSKMFKMLNVDVHAWAKNIGLAQLSLHFPSLFESFTQGF